MAKRTFTAGATSQTVDVFIQDSASTTGAGLSGLVYNTASLAAYYRLNATGSATSITLATQTVGGAYSSGGFVEIQATNMKGLYRLDIPNACIATAGWVTIHLYGAANMAPVFLELEIVAYNPFDSVRLGLTALPNAAAEASGGLVTRGTGTGQITVSGGAVTVGTNSDKNGYSLSQSFPSNFASLGINASGHISRVTLVDTITTYTGNTVQTGDSYARIGANGASLSAIPWNASWDAEVQSECTDALNAYDPPTNTEMVAAFTEIKGATWASTDTLEAIRDRGDAAWVTSTFSITASAIASQVRTELTTELGRIDAAITTRASQTSVDDIPTNSELTTALADLPTNSELTTALADLPTVAEFEARTIVAANYFDPAADTVLLAAATCNKIADHVRRRTQANVEASSDGDTLGYFSEYGMIQQAQESNTVDNAGKLTVYKTDGTTELAQRTLTTDDTAESITGIE